MHGKRVWIALLLLVTGVCGGIGIGLLIGWIVAPVEYIDTDMSYLHAAYKDDFVLMTSEAYALDGDLDAAHARLALLQLPDPAMAVADLAEKAISQNQPLSNIRALATLAAVLGAQRDALLPYLSPVDGAVP